MRWILLRIEQKCSEIINLVNALKKQLLQKIADEKREKEIQINAQLSQFLNLEVILTSNFFKYLFFSESN